MEEPKDKRTKAYKEWKKLQGAGDLVEKVLQVTKVDKVAKWLLGEDCGCEKRKEFLNRVMPFKKIECLNEKEYNWLNKYYNGQASRIDSSTQDDFNVIYNDDKECIEVSVNVDDCVCDHEDEEIEEELEFCNSCKSKQFRCDRDYDSWKDGTIGEW